MKIIANLKNRPSKYLSLVLISLMVVFILATYIIGLIPDHSWDESQIIDLADGWQYKWESKATGRDEAYEYTNSEYTDSEYTDSEYTDSADNEWRNYSLTGERLLTSSSKNTAWFRIKLPEYDDVVSPTLYFDAVLSDDIELYYDGTLIYDSNSSNIIIKNASQAVNRFVVPIYKSSNNFLTMKVTSHTGFIGPRKLVMLGSHKSISKFMFRRELDTILLGFFFIIFAMFLVPNFIYLKSSDLKILILVCFFVIGMGLWLISSSFNFNLLIIDNNGVRLFVSTISVYLTIISLLMLIRQIFVIKNKISGKIWYINLCIFILLTIGHTISYFYFEELALYFINMWQALVAVDFIILVILIIQNTRKGNTDAKIFATGLVLYLLLCSYELIQYRLFNVVPTMYKWGLMIFVVSLVLILGRRFSEAHEKLVIYSRELEENNNVLSDTLTELKQSKREIEELNVSLELRVKQRTKELQDAMEQLVQTQEQLIQSEKMAALGGLVAGIAHEVNTPIGIGVTAVSHLDKEISEIEDIYKQNKIRKQDFENYINISRELTDVIMTNLRNASDLIKSFKNVAVDQSSEEKRVFNIKKYINEIIVSLRPELKKSRHKISVECPEDLELEGYPGAFSQIITNLIINSLTHAYDVNTQGNIIISAKLEDNNMIVYYADDGKGIESDNLSKIYNPFFTTNRGGGSNGLGLNILYNIVTQRFGGNIRCNSEVNKGTEFIINIPMKN